MKSWVFVIAIFAAGTMSSVAFADDISTTREVGAASVGAAIAHRVISNRAAREDIFLYFTEIRARDDEKTLGYLVNKLKELRGQIGQRPSRIRYYETEIA